MFSTFCLSEIYTLIEKSLDCSPFYKASAVIFLNLFLSSASFSCQTEGALEALKSLHFLCQRYTSILELSQTRKSLYQNSCLLSYGHFYSKWPKFPKILLFTYPDHRPWGLLVKHLFAIFVVSPKSGGACIHCRINSTGSWRIKPVIGWIYQIKSSAVGTHA